MSDYTPISCSAYDALEAAAVKRSPLRLTFKAPDGILVRDVFVLDLFAKEKVEYVKLQDQATHEEFVLRLDAIERIADVRTNTIYSPNTCTPRSQPEDDL